jgi:hypothetical protein
MAQYHEWTKVKAKWSLCVTKYHVMETYVGVEVQFHTFLTSALDGGEWSASRTGRSSQGKKYPVPIG